MTRVRMVVTFNKEDEVSVENSISNMQHVLNEWPKDFPAATIESAIVVPDEPDGYSVV